MILLPPSVHPHRRRILVIVNILQPGLYPALIHKYDEHLEYFEAHTFDLRDMTH